MKSVKENNYAFIDNNNLHLAIQSLGWRINWYRFRVLLKDKYRVRRAFMFLGRRPGFEGLYEELRRAGFEIIFKEVIEQGRETKGNIDAEMVMWTMHYLYDAAEPFDKAVLITGDGDFACLAEYLRERDKLLKVAIPNKNRYSYFLRKFDRFYISDLRVRIEYIKNEGHKTETNLPPAFPRRDHMDV